MQKFYFKYLCFLIISSKFKFAQTVPQAIQRYVCAEWQIKYKKVNLKIEKFFHSAKRKIQKWLMLCEVEIASFLQLMD